VPVTAAPVAPRARRSYPRRVLPLALSLSTGDVILIVVFAAIPIALAAFVLGAGDALKQIGKGPFAVEFDSDLSQRAGDAPRAGSAEGREAEIRQMLEAKAYRQRARGETVVDIDAELTRLLADRPPRPAGADPGLAEEVRQLVVARNERRIRQGQEPLDVDEEVERQLRELENLGQ
jgi:hypothetical protein